MTDREQRVMHDAARNVNRDWKVDSKYISNKTLTEYVGANEIDQDTAPRTTPADRVSRTLALITRNVHTTRHLQEISPFCITCTNKYHRQTRSAECECE